MLCIAFLLAQAVHAQGHWKITQLTSCTGGKSFSPRVSPDGERVYFVSDCSLIPDRGPGGQQVYMWEDGGIKRLTSEHNCMFTDLAPSPDEDALAFSSNCFFQGKNSGRGMEIVVMELSGKVRVITQGNGLPSASPSWSHDNRRLAFVSRADLSDKNPDGSQEIFMAELNAEEIKVRQLSDTSGNGICEAPAVAADSVVARCKADVAGTAAPGETSSLPVIVDGRSVGGNPDLNYELMSFSFKGKPRQLTRTETCENGPPALHPQGRLIAFTSNCGKERMTGEFRPRLHFMAQRAVPAEPGLHFQAGQLRWSKDGSRLVFSSPLSTGVAADDVNPERNPEIFILDVPVEKMIKAVSEHKSPPRTMPSPVTDFPFGFSKSPDISRDGKTVVFVSFANLDDKNQDGGPEIMRAVFVEEE